MQLTSFKGIWEVIKQKFKLNYNKSEYCHIPLCRKTTKEKYKKTQIKISWKRKNRIKVISLREGWKRRIKNRWNQSKDNISPSISLDVNRLNTAIKIEIKLYSIY